MRIYKNKYYVLQHTPGCSGFKQWNKRTYTVCTGFHARHNKLKIAKEFLTNGRGKFSLADGHLPDYQPRAKEADALRWLDDNFYNEICLLNPEVYSLSTEV